MLSAQTLKITEGNITYLFPASQAGTMPYENGSSLTVMGKTFSLSEVTMAVDETTVTDSRVEVVYSGTSAAITVAGNIARYLTIQQSGAHVSIVQSSEVAQEITYSLSGASTNGEFYHEGSYKATVELNGLTLTNSTPVYSGAAVHIQNGKRINVKVITGTTSTLVDAASGAQSACLYIKGHAEFKQYGTLNITGKKDHGIKAGDYLTIKNATINVLSSVGDGINCNEYFLIQSGSVTITNAKDDGIQCDIDDETTGSTGETTDHEDEDSGNMYILGGSIHIESSDEGISAMGSLSISGGNVYVKAADDAINSGVSQTGLGDMTISGGFVYAYSTGNDGIDANGNCYIQGGVIFAIGASSPEMAIDANSEKNKKLYITGGTIIAVGSLENGASISGGTAKQTTSWTANQWYALYDGGTLVAAFYTPTKSSGGGGRPAPPKHAPDGFMPAPPPTFHPDSKMPAPFWGPGPGGGGGGSQALIVFTAGTPTLTSNVTVSEGTEIFKDVLYSPATVSGGSSVSLSDYSGGSGGPGGGGGNWW